MSVQLLPTWQIAYRRTRHLNDNELWDYNRLYIKMYMRSPGLPGYLGWHTQPDDTRFRRGG
jgi:hypothetical protein